MDITDLYNKTKEEKEEIVLTIKEFATVKVSRKQIDEFIKTRIDEIEEYIKDGIPARANKLNEMDNIKKALLLNGALLIIERAEKVCDAIVRLSYQLQNAEPDNCFTNTDLFCISVNMLNN